jgi:hypothetical protein
MEPFSPKKILILIKRRFVKNTNLNNKIGPLDPSFYIQAAIDERDYQRRFAYEQQRRITYHLKEGWNLPKLQVGDGRFHLAIAYVRPGVEELSFSELHDEINRLMVLGKSRLIVDDPYSLFLISLSFSSLLFLTGITSGTVKINFPWLGEWLNQLFNR